jgi:hypothetical protein
MTADDVRTAVAQRFPGSDAAPADNEFVIFSKPELGRLTGDDLDKVWDLFAELLETYEVTVHTSMTLTGPELEASGAMQDHYGVINQISRLGRPALTEPAEAALAEAYGDTLSDAVVLGGHQFLDDYPDVSAYALGLLFANAEVKRLGPGTYAGLVTIDGILVVILNGFHPRQLSFFTAEDTVCAFLHASSPTSWGTLRSDLIGTTDPAKADGASIRGRLFADPASFGLESVSYNFNGVHMSAGPLEGLAELNRFFGSGASVASWTFAQALSGAGLTEDAVTDLLANPTIETGGERGTAFDLTEGLDAADAAPLLAGATPAE